MISLLILASHSYSQPPEVIESARASCSNFKTAGRTTPPHPLPCNKQRGEFRTNRPSQVRLPLCPIRATTDERAASLFEILDLKAQLPELVPSFLSNPGEILGDPTVLNQGLCQSETEPAGKVVIAQPSLCRQARL